MKKTFFLLACLGLFLAVLSACGGTTDESILTDPAEVFLCQVSDLPVKGQYLIPSAGTVFQTSNNSILDSGDAGEYEYIDVTGRLDGWVAQYQRNADVPSLPDLIYCGSVTYATAQGARVSVTKYNAAARGVDGWELADRKVSIGDEGVVLVYRSPSASEVRIWKVIEFSYRNVVIDVGGLGLDENIGLADLKAVGKAVIERLQAGTLATPTPVLPMP
jgi:hypothetical protein